MKVTIVIERNPDGSYQARPLAPVSVASRAATATEAQSQLELQLRLLLGDDIDIEVQSAGQANPWLASIGTLPDDDVTRAWEELIEENRRIADTALASDERMRAGA